MRARYGAGWIIALLLGLLVGLGRGWAVQAADGAAATGNRVGYAPPANQHGPAATGKRVGYADQHPIEAALRSNHNPEL
ncbi:MAG TPA: hypothetical protein VKY74_02875 [Chloroflexia bacterium]|nr:hypothetical protein [Chloroflexia bacterium]